MLKKAFILLLFFVLIPLSYGINITSNYNSYGYKETVIGVIDLSNSNNPNINFQNVILLDKNFNKKSISLTLNKINNVNYLYSFDFPDNATYGNYTLLLNNIEIVDNDILSIVNSSQIIQFVPKNYSLSVNPAIIYVDNILKNNFLLIIIKNNLNSVNISLDKPSFVRLNSDHLSLKNNDTFVLQVLLDKNYNYNYGFNDYLKIDYDNQILSIPIYVYNTNIPNISLPTKKLFSINEKSFINKTLDLNETINGPFLFKNIGDITINKVSLEIPENLNQVINFQQKEFNEVSVDQEIDFNLTLNPNKIKNIGTYEGNLIINYDNNYLEFPIRLNFINQNNFPTNFSENFTNINYTDETNLSNISIAPNKGNTKFNFVWIIVIVVAIFIVILIIFLFNKPRKKKDTENFDQIISNYMKK